MDPIKQIQYQLALAKYMLGYSNIDEVEKAEQIYEADLVEKKYKKTGYHQSDTQNNNYKNGSSNYRKRALDRKGKKCQRCGSTKNLRVHHKDGNRKNNKLSNLSVICASCHEHSHVRKGEGS